MVFINCFAGSPVRAEELDNNKCNDCQDENDFYGFFHRIFIKLTIFVNSAAIVLN
jgi:hypothetical protein